MKKSLVNQGHFGIFRSLAAITLPQTTKSKKDMTRENYIAAQAAFIAMTNLAVGDSVTVIRAAKDGQFGWPNVWPHEMDESVEKKLQVVSISDRNIGLSNGYNYPFFVLHVEKDGLPKELPCGDYRAKIMPDGSVEVGCQTLSFETVEAIYLAAKKEKGE